MSLESKIEALTNAVIVLTAKLEGANVPAPLGRSQALAPLDPVAPVAPVAPVSAPQVSHAPSQHQAVAMPAPPTFMNPAPAPVSSVPFSDPKGLIEYVMGAYKAMGPQKGAQIQNVLVGLGYQNINDVKPEHYGALFAGVEQLKAS